MPQAMHRALMVHDWHTRLLATLPKALPPRFLHLRTGRCRMHIRQRTMIRLLAPPLSTRLYIPATRAAATQSHLYQPCEDRERASNPHEDKDSDADLRANVQLCHASDSVAEDDEHDGCDNRCGGDDEGVEERKDRDGEGEPAREDGDGHEEDEDEGEAGACEEEAEHPSGDVLDEIEDVIDVGREVDCSE
jgi:hypothetical protein